MTNVPLQELDLIPYTSHVPFNELIDRLEMHLKRQARTPGLDERLRMAVAKAIEEGRSSMTDMRTPSSGARVEKGYEVDETTFYLIAAE